MSNPDQRSTEMRIYDRKGKRLYLTNIERKQFIEASKDETRENRMFCRVLHDTGCRPSEALELTANRICLDQKNIIIRSLKKREYDMRGNKKEPVYREVPVTDKLVDMLDMVFDLKKRQANQRKADKPLWTMSRATSWRMVKRVMTKAGIKGPQATSKGLRHGLGVAMLVGEKPAPIHIVSQILGHSDTKTTEIYLQATGLERRQLVLQALNNE